MRCLSSFLFSFTLLFSSLSAQVTHPKNGVADNDHAYYAFTNATIYVSASQRIEKATLLVRDGVVKEVGTAVSLPKNTVRIDLKGKFIYPSFIDPYADYGMPTEQKKEEKGKRSNRGTQLETKKSGAFSWNEHVHPEDNAIQVFKNDEKAAKEWLSVGYGIVLTHRHDGIVRGTSALVTLGNQKENLEIIKDKAALQLSFKRGSGKQNYPTSLMGVMALIRQTYYDALWYGQQPQEKEYNASLQALAANSSLPTIVEAGDVQSVLRANRLALELNRQFIIVGGGDEYQHLNEVGLSKAALIVPLVFPEAYDVEQPYDALNLSLAKMKHWELAPANPAFLVAAGVEFAFTLKGLKQKKDFLPNLRKAVQHGMREEDALRALTLAPAKMLQQQDKIGDLQVGKWANFIICSENLFHDEAVIHEHWIRGKKQVIHPEEMEIRGEYNLNVDGQTYALSIKGSRLSPKATVSSKGKALPTVLSYTNRSVNLHFFVKEQDEDQLIRLSGNINDAESRIWAGKAELSDGKWVDWAAIRQSAFVKEKSDSSHKVALQLGKPWFPNKAYGFDSLPTVETLLFKNATVWTNEDTGILKRTDIAIANGKIVALGSGLTPVGVFGEKAGEVKIILAEGLHLTSGIIDEHSHIAVSGGVNEAGWNASSEVRIEDVINAEDINIYRQLSGGVTASQLLHGSANPIGGQSAIIKLRWGLAPEQLKIAGADGFIKFALGENVKQSNWGDHNKTRFPQSRMGVEQVYYDAFFRAKEYSEPWTLYRHALENKKKKDVVIPPRRDLRLEALVEILQGKRFITCHSYVQSEINMLMHLADSMGFKVNTFTHVLEGYKVADKLKAHGAGASTFSDWWAYKYEVNDAIPYNGALLHEQGVLTAFNSDDAEMGRRLNQEAAKAVKYGGVSEEEAWKFVTLNPAKMLHLDHRMGSIRVGKDADLVLWTIHPLSAQAKVVQTYIDGICYFDRERDAALQIALRNERARLIQKMVEAKKKGQKTQPVETEKKGEDHCDTVNLEEIE
jgi:imidazolonepropionase-like amidohydrolase